MCGRFRAQFESQSLFKLAGRWILNLSADDRKSVHGASEGCWRSWRYDWYTTSPPMLALPQLSNYLTLSNWRARTRLYRSQNLQISMRWKALAEIYKMHSFAPFWNRIPKKQEKRGEKRTWSRQPREKCPGEAHKQPQRATQYFRAKDAPFWNRIPKNEHRSLSSNFCSKIAENLPKIIKFAQFREI